MFYIISKKTQKIHREPTRPLWRERTYASERSAKAGITRTIKYYEKAIAEVRELEAQGKPDYHARMYNAYRDATDPVMKRTHCADINNYEIVAVDEYVEPQITRTGRRPYDGKEITVTLGINDVGTYMDPLCESHWTN